MFHNVSNFKYLNNWFHFAKIVKTIIIKTLLLWFCDASHSSCSWIRSYANTCDYRCVYVVRSYTLNSVWPTESKLSFQIRTLCAKFLLSWTGIHMSCQLLFKSPLTTTMLQRSLGISAESDSLCCTLSSLVCMTLTIQACVSSTCLRQYILSGPEVSW